MERAKTQIKPKPTNEIKLNEQKTTKATIFCAHKTSKMGEIIYFAVLKKKKEKNEIVLVTLFTILTTFHMDY